MKQQEVDHINHCAQAVKRLRRAKRHVFQNCPDDVFRVHIRNKHHLCKIPKERKLVRCKWVYRTKYGPNGKIDKHKARLVAKGFSQVEGIDYTETFSPVAKMNSIRLVLSLAASLKWEVHQMDVKSVFLHGDLHEEIYMEQPIGFIQTDSSLVCRLKKSLYGLKQAPRAWYAKMDSFLLESGFSRCHSDNTVYTKKVGEKVSV